MTAGCGTGSGRSKAAWRRAARRRRCTVPAVRPTAKASAIPAARAGTGSPSDPPESDAAAKAGHAAASDTTTATARAYDQLFRR